VGSAGGPLLLERAEELAAVDAALGAARSGKGAVLLFDGPAGIGKSALVSKAKQQDDGDLATLTARGAELESPFSFGVVRQLFEPVLARLDEPRRGAVFGGAATHARALFDPAAAPAAANDPNAVFAVLHGLYWLALNLAEERPLLVVVDDLQWADAPSARWVAYLGRRLEGTPIALIAAVRPIEHEEPAVTELLADPGAVILRPKALSAAAAEELVRATWSGADSEFCLACHRASAGNPLLLNELLRSVVAEGLAPVAASIPAVERLAPDAVSRSVRRRLGELAPQAARLAQAIATLGDDVRSEHAAALAGLEQREVAPTAAALARADLIASDPPLRFVHPLVRNAVYELVPAHERAEAHASAAALLTAARAPEHQVAAQLLYAPPGSVDDAAPMLTTAGRRAAAEGAPESAARYVRRALDEDLAPDERGELLVELAAVESELGSPTVIAHLREALTLLGDSRRRAEASLALGHELYWAGDEEEGVEVLERALGDHADIDIELRHRLQAELVVNATRLPSQYERARELLASLDVTVDDGPGARVLLSGQAYHEAAAGGDAERAAATALAALTAMSHEERARNYTAGSYALLRTDRLDEGVRLLDATLADVRRRGAVFYFSSLSMTRAIFQYARGALTEAEADGRAALETLPRRNVWFGFAAHGWLAQILVERGAVDEAASLLDAVEPTVASDAFSRAPLLRARALVDAARGDHRSALAHTLDLGAALAAFGHTNPASSLPAWRSLAALEHHALGETEEAATLAREEVDLAGAWGSPGALGRALRILGSIEGGDKGIERIWQAVAILADSPARLEHAYALANLGAALRRANRRADAREPLRQSLEFAQRVGATLLAEQAHEELIATGARPRRVELRGAAALTPSERRIAGMAAEGMTNREIAQALFVTLRTVEMHLSNAFRKLEVSARTQLSGALADQPAAA
jgi:DNA-binding CsgD family transcriptional regulator